MNYVLDENGNKISFVKTEDGFAEGTRKVNISEVVVFPRFRRDTCFLIKEPGDKNGSTHNYSEDIEDSLLAGLPVDTVIEIVIEGIHSPSRRF